MKDNEIMELKVRIGSVFRPGTPIDKQQLFAGRLDQVNDVINATLQPGRHVVMFGERGVGKTSLARVISDIMASSSGYKVLDCGTINCDRTDDFNSLWRKIFREISYLKESQEPGFSGPKSQAKMNVESTLPNRILRSDDVRYFLSKITGPTLIIIDEMDMLTNNAARAELADTIKNLSDHGVNATIILVGVADSVAELVAEHQSIQRALVEVPMPRMSSEELTKILDTGFGSANMGAGAAVKSWIALLSQGLPHYTHSLGLYSAFNAVEDGRSEITVNDVLEATKKTVQKSHVIASVYNKATGSPQKQNLYAKVLSACALTHTDDLGFFTAAAVSVPMSRIMARPYYVPNFSRHLFDFCEPTRGPVLKKIGRPRRVRFRFIDAMMQPFVIIHDYSIGALTNKLLEESKGRLQDSSNP
jgi:hypothetical protein